MRNNRDVIDYFSDNYFINKNALILMDSSIIGFSVDNAMLLRQYQEELDNFEAVSRFVVQHDVLMP